MSLKNTIIRNILYSKEILTRLNTNTALHTTPKFAFLDARDKNIVKKEKELIVHQSEYFNEVLQKSRDKKTFQEAINIYLKRNSVYRRGYVEFLYAALEKMKEFNVHRDIECYKSLLNLFPKSVMVAHSVWQVEFMHYPKQQQCCVDVLEYMETHGVIPDDDIGYHLVALFGDDSFAMRRYQRMMYWMPKFRYANPYYVPFDLPQDHLELAKMALVRMCVDLENKMTVFDTRKLNPEFPDDTFIVSGLSPTQVSFINSHNIETPLIVDGPYVTWLRMYSLPYFVLRTEGPSRDKVRFDEGVKKAREISERCMDEFTLFKYNKERPNSILKRPTDHELETTTILGVCVPGLISKDISALWITGLQESIPALSKIPILFRMRSQANIEGHLFFQDVTMPTQTERVMLN